MSAIMGMTLAGVACDGGASGSSTGSPEPTVSAAPEVPRSFTEADLPSLVLQEQDVPSGVEYATGPIAFEDVASTAALSKVFRAGGFVAAYRSAFWESPDGGPNLVSVAILFETEEGASAAVTAFRDDLRGRLAYAKAPVEELDPPAGFGDEALGLTQIEVFNGPVHAYFWRMGNVTLMASSGAVDEEAFVRLAETMLR